MPKCLGIYIENNIIKYAKVEKNKNDLKIESSSVIFYEREHLRATLDKIIRETYSSNDLISINISNEIYNYFDIFAELKPSDRAKSIDLDFELLCGEKGYSKDSLERRTYDVYSRENTDKMKVIHISTNKEKLQNTINEFGNVKVSTATPISTSIVNLLSLNPKENSIIVNIENETKITTILEGEIYNIDILPNGMKEILENINLTENSIKKSYECCKNTTIYTKDTQMLQTEENDYLDNIMPVLYKIVSEVKDIMGISLKPIDKVYITGLATAINNVDLYFQEYIPNAKCELLKPFFVEMTSIKKPIKDYIEVNSAVALALEGLGLGHDELNFKPKKITEKIDLNADVDFNKISKTVFGGNFLEFSGQLKSFDKFLVRLATCLMVAIIGYSVASNSILNQIDDKRDDIKKSDEEVTTQIGLIQSQINDIKNGEENYRNLIDLLSVSNDDNSDVQNAIVIEKDAIPNLLNRIVHVIPTQVKLTSIQNTTGKHIVIGAQAEKHEQLGYFKAVLDVNGILENVKSTSGLKNGDIITITIEGDLP